MPPYPHIHVADPLELRSSRVLVTWHGPQEMSPDPSLPQDAASFKAEPEPVYSMEAADYQDASSQQGLAYAPDAVYEATETSGHYQAGRGQGIPPNPPLLLCASDIQLSDVPCLACA